MKSVIVEGPNRVAAAMGWTQDPLKPIYIVLDLAPMHIAVRVIFCNDFDADVALTTSGDGWVVLHDSFPKYGAGGQVLFKNPNFP